MIYRRVLRYYRPFLAPTVVGLLLTLVGIGVNLLKPWPFKFIVDQILPAGFGLSARACGLARLHSPPLPRAHRSATCLGHHQPDYQLHLREDWVAGPPQAAHRSLRLPAVALAQVSRRAPLGRFELPRRLRFAGHPDDLQQGLHQHFRLRHHARRHVLHHAAARLATDACCR